MRLPPFWKRLPEEIKARFGQRRPGRQRAMAAQDHLLLVLHKAPGADDRDREPVFFWRKPDGTWESGQRGGISKLMEHIQEFDSAEIQLSKEYQQVQSSEGYFDILEKAAPLCHAAKNLEATLQAAREAVPDDRDLIDARDWAYEVERSLDLLYTDTRNALDSYVARHSEEETHLSMQSNRIANRLNVLAAIFLPLTAITGVFGMNLPSGVERSPVWAFWLVLLLGILLGFVMSWWAVRGAVGNQASRARERTDRAKS